MFIVFNLFILHQNIYLLSLTFSFCTKIYMYVVGTRWNHPPVRTIKIGLLFNRIFNTSSFTFYMLSINTYFPHKPELYLSFELSVKETSHKIYSSIFLEKS